MKPEVVTRIAPSPTGEMHIGTVRTALFNYIFAKQRDGIFFVRIEDTDKERNKEEWVDAIWRDFEWCGITPDAQYRQSEHVARHKELLQELVASGKAYISREPKKDDPTQHVEVVRLKNPGTSVTFTDLIRGEVTFDTTELGDFVIARSIEDPLYHFAVVVDDGDAKVTHVLRAEEHISNTPRQILILEALGFTRPIYAHFPLILAPDRTKLSKRKHAASIHNYRQQGYIPEALLNYLALLGWNPGTPQELFTMDELMEAYSIDRMQKSGAVFDIEKLKWFNQQHLRRLSDEEFLRRLEAYMNAGPLPGYVAQIVPLLKERSQTLLNAMQALQSGEYEFLEETIQYPRELLWQGAKTDEVTVKKHLEHTLGLLRDMHEEFTADSVKNVVFPYASQQGRASVLWPMRTALSGREKSPDPFALCALLGRKKSLERIEQAIQML